MTRSFYIYETQHNESARKCKSCGRGMDEGYLHEESGNTYCTRDCLDKRLTQTEQDAMTIDELFWTDWHDELEVQND